jgi:hypothetical protein
MWLGTVECNVYEAPEHFDLATVSHRGARARSNGGVRALKLVAVVEMCPRCGLGTVGMKVGDSPHVGSWSNEGACARAGHSVGRRGRASGAARRSACATRPPLLRHRPRRVELSTAARRSASRWPCAPLAAPAARRRRWPRQRALGPSPWPPRRRAGRRALRMRSRDKGRSRLGRECLHPRALSARAAGCRPQARAPPAAPPSRQPPQIRGRLHRSIWRRPTFKLDFLDNSRRF